MNFSLSLFPFVACGRHESNRESSRSLSLYATQHYRPNIIVLSVNFAVSYLDLWSCCILAPFVQGSQTKNSQHTKKIFVKWN